ncbi:hypothetical protein PQX77_002166 [Marasmius sp. AFHP31]|nr:hypothetical protein PQX77_002166 [Marasmius sp. AFHP31]
MRITAFLDIEAQADSEEEEEELEDNLADEDSEDDNDSLKSTEPPSASPRPPLQKHRQEFDEIIRRYGDEQRNGGNSQPDGEHDGRDAAFSRSSPEESVRAVIGPVLARNPNSEIAAILGLDAELGDAREKAKKDYEWAQTEGTLKEGTTVEDFLQAPMKRVGRETRVVERAARGETTANMRGWEKWAATRNQKAPVANWAPSRPIAPGEWVRIRNGTYRGDEGMVYDETRSSSDPSEITYAVFLVPRIAPPHTVGAKSNKRKRTTQRWAPCAFRPNEYKAFTRDDDVKRKALGSNVVYRYSGMTFSHGLLIKSFPSRRLVPVDCVDQPLIDLFRNHPFCRNFPFPMPKYWRFSFGEEVFVSDDAEEQLSPMYKPRSKGVLQDHIEGHFLVNFGTGADGGEDIQVIPERRLRKVIAPGDYVHVVSGPFEGREGLVVEKHGSLLAVSEKNDASGKVWSLLPFIRSLDLPAPSQHFLVDKNCARREKASFHRSSSVPWLGQEVRIELGRHAGQFGVIQDVRLGRYGDCFLLSLYVPALNCSTTAEDSNVYLKGYLFLFSQTKPSSDRWYRRTQTRLWEFFPQENPAWQIAPRMRGIRSGQIPWKRVKVAVTGGQFKGYLGTVKDVHRIKKPAVKSDLELSVELEVIRANASMPYERIPYDHVREWRTGKTLNDFRPLTHSQNFFAPNPDFKGDRKRLREFSLPIVTLDAPNPLTQVPVNTPAFDELLRQEYARLHSSPLHLPDASSSSMCPPDPLATPPPEDPPAHEASGSRAGTPMPDYEWGPLNVWHPSYDDCWEVMNAPCPPTPKSMSPAPPSPPRRRIAPVRRSPPVDSIPYHWIYHKKLSGIPIDVEITGGERCTTGKKYGAHVMPILGKGIVRDQRKASHHDVAVGFVARPQRRPNKNALAVVIPQQNPHDNEHLGKLVRFVDCFFDGPKVAVYRRWICAVVDGMDNASKLTGEIIVLPITDVEAVKQSDEVAAWAKRDLMAKIRKYMSSRDTSNNSGGERSYEDVTTAILGQEAS